MSTAMSRRFWPQKVRTRLAVLYAGLFLVSGSALLGLTYGLVAEPARAALVLLLRRVQPQSAGQADHRLQAATSRFRHGGAVQTGL